MHFPTLGGPHRGGDLVAIAIARQAANAFSLGHAPMMTATKAASYPVVWGATGKATVGGRWDVGDVVSQRRPPLRSHAPVGAAPSARPARHFGGRTPGL